MNRLGYQNMILMQRRKCQKMEQQQQQQQGEISPVLQDEVREIKLYQIKYLTDQYREIFAFN